MSTKNDKESGTSEKIGRMEAHIEVMREDMTGIQSELKVMNTTLAVNTKQLELHIEGVKLAREQNDLLKQDVDSRLQPLQDHVTFVNKFSKLVMWSVALPASIYYIILIVQKIRG